MIESLKVVDLFAGVGGLSLGAARAGFNLVSAFEIDPQAISSHYQNFPSAIHSDIDINHLSGKDLLDISKLKEGELHGIIGGPPCQGFSAIGKKNPMDLRNDLFIHFFRLVSETNPRFFLAENVPGILYSKNDLIREKAFSLVTDKYRIVGPIKVVASEFGAPTTRTRIFYIGFNLKTFPTSLTKEDFKAESQISQVIVEEALKGLPSNVDPSWQTEINSWQKVQFSLLNSSYFNDRVVDFVPKEVGNRIALDRLNRLGEVSGFLGTIHSKIIEERYRNLSFGEQDKISKSIKLNPKGFCPTLRAGTDKAKGSFQAVRPIHYEIARVITPREAARLQGFPDWFLFHPTKWHSFRQIGNSVSPIVAERILRKIYSAY
jgi:DNA (cytosine-5)-methyltransferase 1